ncbi:unknown [Choristoneura occidentalis granulovirus]|uniref:Uncharacterized protein n=1 Tax=Choristoneura occidentalis granulovirus TaxID=364745 RepID=Q1A4S2_9BBAC|nr:unknown [Choristoneura fumiferana granulovirus]ABC61158.1 unknown [Choristoneura fumiferana granulovirus]
MHFFMCEYNDLFQFEWPAILDRSTLHLWLGIDCLRNKGFTFPINVPVKKFNNVTSHIIQSKNNVIVIKQKKINLDDQLDFCKSTDLLLCNQDNDVYQTILEQFLFCHLPYYLNTHLNNLQLISLFDVSDYWNMLKNCDMVRKYWLFRLKIVTLTYEKTKNEVQTNLEVQNNLKTSNKLTFTDIKTSNDVETVETVINNVKMQFKLLQNYNSLDKVYVALNFNKLLKGSVGLLEVWLKWK